MPHKNCDAGSKRGKGSEARLATLIEDRLDSFPFLSSIFNLLLPLWLQLIQSRNYSQFYNYGINEQFYSNPYLNLGLLIACFISNESSWVKFESSTQIWVVAGDALIYDWSRWRLATLLGWKMQIPLNNQWYNYNIITTHKNAMNSTLSENVFETHPNLLKFAKARIESASTVWGLRAGVLGILKDYVTLTLPIPLKLSNFHVRN